MSTPGTAPEPDHFNKTPEEAWRENFDAFERMIGRPLEAFLGSEEFADAAAAFIKANADATARFEEQARQWSALWNLPTSRGIRDLQGALEDMGKRVAVLADRLDAVEARLISGSSRVPSTRKRST